jgi:hypothetical protein
MMAVAQSLRVTPPERWLVDQVIVFDWYDGPRSGLCRLSLPNVEFRFDLVDEQLTADDLDDRVFSIGVLPVGSVGDALTALSLLGGPAKPVWAPVWKHEDLQSLMRAEQQVDEVCSRAVETGLVVRTKDFKAFAACRDVSEKPPGVDWFTFLSSRPGGDR